MAHLRPRALFLIFAALAASGSVSTAGGAQNTHTFEPTDDPVEVAERTDTTPPDPAQALDADATDWSALIDARLRNLAARRAADAEATTRDAALAARLRSVVGTAGGNARVAVHVRDLQRDATVFDRGGDRLLNPASNHKLVTAVAALELLGSDYRFTTRVVRDGDTLYVIGEGDPSLQIDDLYGLAEQVRGATQLSSIERIVVDDSAFSPRFFGPGYDPEGPGVSYMAPSGALSLQFNVVEITVRPGGYRDPVGVQVDPPCAHVRVESRATTGGGRAVSVDSRRDGDTTVVEVRGGLPAGHAPVVFRKRVVDPGLYAASAFADVLARIADADPLPVTRGKAPAHADVVAAHRSAPLSEVLAPAMKFSNNFTTEQVLRTLGWRTSGRPGDWNAGREAIERFWAALGLDPEDLVFENASGLSRIGRVTPRALVDLLALTMRDGAPAQDLLTALPVAGRDGTLRKRLIAGRGRVRAKTGTLSGVGALTGVVADARGTSRLGFSILINGRLDSDRSRRLQDRVVLALVQHLDAE